MICFTMDGLEYRVFDHLYAVSRCGKVLRNMVSCLPTKHTLGYQTCSTRLVHRMVATCWIDKPEQSNLVHHKNENKTDNRADNLEWVTPKEHIGVKHEGIGGRYIRTEETREKIRQFRLGKVTSEETKAKQRAALLGRKRPFFHRAGHTKEWKDNMSLNHHKNVACTIFGIEYRSFADASRATGVHRFTLRKRCISKNFPEYEL